MNNTTIEDFCSFEVSELLKAKGFNVGCTYYYDIETKERGFHWTRTDEFTNEDMENGLYGLNRHMISAPTHALAIKWLRVNFGVSLSANRDAYYQETYDRYVYKITWPLAEETKNYGVGSYYYEKPEEAIDAGLLVILQKLIP